MAVLESNKSQFDKLNKEFEIEFENPMEGQSVKAEFYRTIFKLMDTLVSHCKNTLPAEPTPAEIRLLSDTAKRAHFPAVLVLALTERSMRRYHEACIEAFDMLLATDTKESSEFIGTLLKQSYNRLLATDPNSYERLRENNSEEELPLAAAEDIITFGIDNSAHHFWSAFQVIPEVFSRTFNRLPEKDEYVKICGSVHSYLQALLTTHRDIVKCLIEEIRGPDWSGEGVRLWRAYRPEAFTITDDLRLLISSEAIDRTKVLLQERLSSGDLVLQGNRVGCAGIKLLAHIGDWCLKVSKPFLYERLLEKRMLAD